MNEYLMNEYLLDIREISYTFSLTKEIFVKALDNVSVKIRKGEIFGLVGESGSGKSTLARCVMNIYCPHGGKIFYDGIDTTAAAEFKLNRKYLQTSRQLIFQDSGSALNQRMTVADIIAEPMLIAGKEVAYREEEIRKAAKRVGLAENFLGRRPANMSGGERQRVAIARAIAMKPKFIVADEPIASLDVSAQAQIINLFRRLQRENGFTCLFIAHDLAMVEFLCDRVGVLYHGRLLEIAKTKELYEEPRHPYTKLLLDSMPIPDPRRERQRKLPDYHERWESAKELVEVSPGHFVAEAG